MRHGSLGRAVCRIMLITADPVAEAAGTGIMIRTPDQRVRVFVSLTLKELTAERQAVAAAIMQQRSASPKVSS